MNPSKFPEVSKLILSLDAPEETFLHDKYTNENYGFWPHLEYFLANGERMTNKQSIIRRLTVTAPHSMDMEKAWGQWQLFRSAQSEVTTIYIIEYFLSGRILQIIPEADKPVADFRVSLENAHFTVEVKAQSGQQHGDKHPRSNESQFFDPKEEFDLRSWLFAEKISSRSGKPMKPKVLEAEEKEAEILVAMTDFTPKVPEIESQISKILPQSQLMEKRTIHLGDDNLMVTHFFKGKYPHKRELNFLKEIWLYDECYLEKFVVLFENHSILLDHLVQCR